jgi:hypothetical protein
MLCAAVLCAVCCCVLLCAVCCVLCAVCCCAVCCDLKATLCWFADWESPEEQTALRQPDQLTKDPEQNCEQFNDSKAKSKMQTRMEPFHSTFHSFILPPTTGKLPKTAFCAVGDAQKRGFLCPYLQFDSFCPFCFHKGLRTTVVCTKYGRFFSLKIKNWRK